MISIVYLGQQTGDSRLTDDLFSILMDEGEREGKEKPTNRSNLILDKLVLRSSRLNFISEL